MLLQRIYILARGLLGDEAVVVNGVNILLLRNLQVTASVRANGAWAPLRPPIWPFPLALRRGPHHIAKASACGVLEGYAGCLVAQQRLDILPVVQLVVEAIGHAHLARRVAVLDHYQVVLLEEGSPLLQEVQAADGLRASTYIGFNRMAT